MASNTPSSRIGTTWWIAALCGATLVLAAGAALGAWRLTLHGPAAGVAAYPSHTQRQADSATGAVTAPVASAAVHAQGRSTFLVVDAAEPPADVDRAVQQMNSLLASNGLPPLYVMTLSATDLASPIELPRALQEMDTFLAPNGEPPLTAVSWSTLVTAAP